MFKNKLIKAFFQKFESDRWNTNTKKYKICTIIVILYFIILNKNYIIICVVTR